MPLQKQQQQQIRRCTKAAEQVTGSNGSALTCQESQEHSHCPHFSWVSQANCASHLLLHMFTFTRQFSSATAQHIHNHPERSNNAQVLLSWTHGLNAD